MSLLTDRDDQDADMQSIFPIAGWKDAKLSSATNAVITFNCNSFNFSQPSCDTAKAAESHVVHAGALRPVAWAYPRPQVF